MASSRQKRRKARQAPQLDHRQRIMLLQCADKSCERGLGEFALRRSNVEGAESGNPRLVLMVAD